MKQKMSMKYINYLLFAFVGVFLFSSCKYKGPGNSSNTERGIDEADSEFMDAADNTDDNIGSDITKIRLTGKIVTCNKCMGYGLVQDGLSGQPQICKFCWISTNMRVQQGWTGFDGRYGQVDAVFNTLPADYFDGLNWNADNNGGGTGADQMESEIARHEENIAQLEHQLEYIEGSISRTQIEQQIIEERYEIKRLKALLNGM